MRTGGSSPPLPPQWYIYKVLRVYVLLYCLVALRPVKYLLCQSLQTDNRIINYFPSVFVLQAFANFFFLARLISYNLVFSINSLSSQFSWDQALDLLVSVSSMHYCTYTPDLSTLLSSRGLTTLRYGISYLEASFTLRCFQRLSHPHFATLPCRWCDNRCTIGAFILVLSY